MIKTLSGYPEGNDVAYDNHDVDTRAMIERLDLIREQRKSEKPCYWSDNLWNQYTRRTAHLESAIISLRQFIGEY